MAPTGSGSPPDALEALLSAGRQVHGRTPLESLVERIAGYCKVRWVLVSECVDDPTTCVRTLAYWSDGRLVENQQYTLEGTPCEEVIAGNVRLH